MVKKHFKKGKLVGVTGSYQDYLRSKTPVKVSRVNPEGQRSQYGKLVSNGKTKSYLNFVKEKARNPGVPLTYLEYVEGKAALRNKLKNIDAYLDKKKKGFKNLCAIV